MTDAGQSISKPRVVNIDSAIGRSSYQLPVFVALSAEGGEAQVAKTFASARDTFDRVFSVMLDRVRQRRAVEKVEKLVPASAHLKDSVNTEYVLFVRGKAIFWFSSGAAKRAAGRKLLLEHARELADAEQAPFYVLNTRARRLRLAAIVFGLSTLTVLFVLVWQLPIHWILPFGRRESTHAVPPSNGSNNAGDRRSGTGTSRGVPLRIERETFADFDIPTDAKPADEPFPDPVSEPAAIVDRRPFTPAWQKRVIRAPEVAYIPAPHGPLPANVLHIRREPAKAPERRGANKVDPISRTNKN